MLALLVSVLVVAYLVIPGVLFRTLFSAFVPLRAFDRTRTLEFAHSVVVCTLPFLAALFLVHHSPLGRWPFAFPDTWAQGDADYKTVMLAFFGEPFAGARDEFWLAAVRSSQRSARLLFWYMGFVSAEALVLGAVAARWGTLQPKLSRQGWLDRLLTRLLLRNISEWHVLLTSFLFPGTTIRVDVLTVEDRLYQGDVLDFTRDADGKLTGIYLNNAQRYDRAGLLADRATGSSARLNAEYWKPIPGDRLFVFGDKISTLNIRPQTTLAAAEQLARALNPAATVTVRVVDEPLAPSAPDPAPIHAHPDA